MKRVFQVLLCATLFACGGSPGPAKYPDTKLNSSVPVLQFADARKEWTERVTVVPVLERNEEIVYAQQLPSNIEAELRARLARVSAGKGPKLNVAAEVRRADITMYNDFERGDFVRYDVAIGFRVTASSGALLDKGLGGAFREIPREHATAEQMQRTFVECAIAALDHYLASEETLDTINSQLERYLATHPEER